MTKDETRKLLGYIVTFDNRKTSGDQLTSWFEIMRPYHYDEAHKAVTVYFRNTPDRWLMPGHIVQIIRSGSPGSFGAMRCEHGVPKPGPCHDCDHDPDTCEMCLGTWTA
jgi:hypothetical protein